MTSRLLILDDEASVAWVTALMAEHAGHVARFTTDPKEFLDLQLTWEPTHLAVDLVMPEMDGIDVLSMLADAGCRASIIISSGVGGRILEAAKLFATENGLTIAGVLPKPFRAGALVHLLQDGRPATATPPRSRARGGPVSVTVADLAQALVRADGLQVAYQPKVECGTGRLAGFEALARWTHPVQGAVSPAVFIELAERNALIDQVTARVLDQALPWFADLQETHADGPLTLSVNLSGRTLVDPDLVPRLSRRCAEHGVDPSSLMLELTETSRTDDPVMSLRLLTRLRMHGFQLSLDDFGTGYSSMAELARLPFSEIKVDQSFVQGALGSEDSRAVVRSMIALGHDMGLTTTAEGVEDAATLQLMRTLGSNLAQGFHIARPMPPDDARSWANSHRGHGSPASG
ncbi:MAG: EAL domain-containing response regulator [Nocardioides sp.]